MSSSEPPTLEVHCVRCGEYASWTGSRTLSDEQIQQWWEQRSHVTQENGHQANTVLCLTCEALAQEKHDDDEPAKSTGEDKDSSTTIKSDKLVEKIKKLILIRHAESENNVDKREAKLAFTNLKTAQSFPTFSQVRNLTYFNDCLPNTSILLSVCCYYLCSCVRLADYLPFQ